MVLKMAPSTHAHSINIVLLALLSFSVRILKPKFASADAQSLSTSSCLEYSEQNYTLIDGFTCAVPYNLLQPISGQNIVDKFTCEFDGHW
jgi:hypothetical protein